MTGALYDVMITIRSLVYSRRTVEKCEHRPDMTPHFRQTRLTLALCTVKCVSYLHPLITHSPFFIPLQPPHALPLYAAFLASYARPVWMHSRWPVRMVVSTLQRYIHKKTNIRKCRLLFCCVTTRLFSNLEGKRCIFYIGYWQAFPTNETLMKKGFVKQIKVYPLRATKFPCFVQLDTTTKHRLLNCARSSREPRAL